MKICQFLSARILRTLSISWVESFLNLGSAAQANPISHSSDLKSLEVTAWRTWMATSTVCWLFQSPLVFLNCFSN